MKKMIAFLICSSAFLCVFNASASSWLYHGPKNDVVTLIVTANYDQPRLLADLIQTESRQPILFVPAVGKSGDITFCPPVRRSKPLVIEESKLTNFVTFLKPKRIVVLGDSRFVDSKYVKMLGKSAPVFIAYDQDWLKVANSLSTMLNITYLGSNFEKLRPKVAAMGGYIPVNPATRDVPVDKMESPDNTVAPMTAEEPPTEAAPTEAEKAPAQATDAGSAGLEPELLPGANE